MQDGFSRDDLQKLMEEREGLYVSIYMPTYKVGKEIEQNSIRLKNLLNQAEEDLTGRGMGAADAQAMLASARALIDDRSYWQHQSEGLAIFIAQDFTRAYRLPIGFREEAIVEDRFYLKPLLPLFSGDGLFYILALSQNQSRLFQATRDSVEALSAEEIPDSLAEALRYDDLEPQLQQHTSGAPNTPGNDPTIFHGHAIGRDDNKQDILRYFRRIDSGLAEMFGEERAPLVLAAVEYLHPLYREANTYNNLMDDGITGNPEEVSAQELHQQAWEIVQDQFDQSEQEASQRYNDLIGTGLASSNIREIVPAAHYGRVESLFVALDQHQWGTFDPQNREVELDEEQTADNQDLMDAAAIQTFLNSGKVFAVEPGQVPGNTSMAAVFRY